MGLIKEHLPVLLILGGISRYPEAIRWAVERAECQWSPIVLSSPVFDFAATEFYRSTMGADLKKQFFAFEQLIPPEQLVAIKRTTNQWEQAFCELAEYSEVRPLNLDPGYVTEAKLVLATTKDRDHRVYLGEGIFAEVTLCFQRGSWQCRPWTYPDYRRKEYHFFFDQCRRYLRARYGKRAR